MRTIEELDFDGKKVLMRVDFNVPLNDKGEISDDLRIQAALPSIRYILDHGGSLILMSHLGRPQGKRVPELSLTPVAKHLSELLGIYVEMAPDCVGEKVAEKARDLKAGSVLLLENLRFHEAETDPEADSSFAKQLSALGDLYVNDAFGTAHRKHASTYSVVSYFPGRSAAGLLLQKEVEILRSCLENPKRPYIAIVGGMKISTKLGLLRTLSQKADTVLIGGAMAHTFLAAKGWKLGSSLVEQESINDARRLMDELHNLVLPVDLFTERHQVASETISKGDRALDIGPQTIDLFKSEIKKAQTVFWNGPVGVFEKADFAEGTWAIADAVSQVQGDTVIGGGDSIAAIRQRGLENQMTHLSTGGGASLLFLELGTLPAIDVLESNSVISKTI